MSREDSDEMIYDVISEKYNFIHDEIVAVNPIYEK
jgi:hypothetical protein